MGPEQDPRILQGIGRGNVKFVYFNFSRVWTYNGKVAKNARKRNLSGEFDQRGCG